MIRDKNVLTALLPLVSNPGLFAALTMYLDYRREELRSQLEVASAENIARIQGQLSFLNEMAHLKNEVDRSRDLLEKVRR